MDFTKQSDEKDGGKQTPSFPETGNFISNFILTPALFIIASFIIYLPVIDHYFVSDDFKVLYRVCLEQIIFIKRFFRPLSDFSIYLNYQWGGLNPRVFNSFNILIHGINGWLVYLTCLSLGHRLDKSGRMSFAIISSAVFLCYPFHNEGVVWMLGRGASLACLFSLLSVIGFYTVKNSNLQYCSVCLCYFISLSAFESTFFLPVIFILLLIFEEQKIRTIRNWGLVFIFTLSLHLIARYLISGSILGSYGNEFFHPRIRTIILNMPKVGGRLILPPSQNAILLLSLFIILTALAAFLIFRNFQKIRDTLPGRIFLFLLGMLFVSCVIPFITGISTQTSETDRILYFPSVFVSMIAGLLVSRVKNSRFQWLAGVLIIFYSLFFLEKNNLNWKKASSVTYSMVAKILEISRMESNYGKVYFLNIPNEIDGAYVFRLGFTDALKLYGKDSGRFIAVNYLSRQELEKIKHYKPVNPETAEIILPPDIILKPDSSACKMIYDHEILKFTTRPGDGIFFWNADRLDSIQACELQKQEKPD
jgi:hypothetical protein